MALARVQIPSPNYSSSRARSRLLVVHTSEGATTFRSLGNFLANPSAEVSYHVGFDDTSAAEIGEYVQPPCKSWSAHSANNEGEHGCCCTPSGASSGWSRADWLARPRMLDACAAWLREEGARYGIPIRKISPDEIRAGAEGVCGHGDCVAAGLGGSHTDPGPNFPWDYVCGATAPAPPEEVREMFVLDGVVPAGRGRDDAGVLAVPLPYGMKTARVDMYVDCDPSTGQSVWSCINLAGKNHGLWSGGNTWELWIPGRKPMAVALPLSAKAVTFRNWGGAGVPLLVAVSGT